MSKKLDRLYIRVDAVFHRDDRYLALPYALRDSAYCLFELLNGWSRDKKTDGRVPAAMALSTGLAMEHPRPKVLRLIEALCAVGLLVRDDDDLVIPKYEKWQDTREEIESKSEARRAAGRAGGQASGRSRREANASEIAPETGSSDEADASPTVEAKPKQNEAETETETETETEIPAPTEPPLTSVRGVSSPARSPDSAEPGDDPVAAQIEGLCERMRQLVSQRAKPPTVTVAWRQDARLLLTRDRRPYDEALEVMAWAAENQFWRRNVLGIPKFREQYDRLLMQMRDEPAPNGGQPRRVDTPATIQARRLEAMAAEMEARGEQ